MRILIFQNGLDIVAECLAIGGIVLFLATGSTVFDGVAGMVIGITLVAAAVWQAIQIKHLLIGTSADAHVIDGIREIVMSRPEVSSIDEISSLHMGPDVLLVNIRVRFAASVDFHEVDYITHSLEWQIEQTYTVVKYIYVKAAKRPLIFEPQLQILSLSADLEQKAS